MLGLESEWEFSKSSNRYKSDFSRFQQNTPESAEVVRENGEIDKSMEEEPPREEEREEGEDIDDAEEEGDDDEVLEDDQFENEDALLNDDSQQEDGDSADEGESIRISLITALKQYGKLYLCILCDLKVCNAFLTHKSLLVHLYSVEMYTHTPKRATTRNKLT